MAALLSQSLALGGRAVAVYLVTVLMVKLMGKREVGQLSALDFVVGVIIGSVAAAPMVDLELPVIPALIPIVVLGSMEILASIISMKNYKFRYFVEDKPTILISDGKIIEKNLKDVRMTFDELKQELRKYGVADINEVEEGTLESGGSFTVIKKKEFLPLTENTIRNVSLHNLDQIIDAYALKARADLQEVIDRH